MNKTGEAQEIPMLMKWPDDIFSFVELMNDHLFSKIYGLEIIQYPLNISKSGANLSIFKQLTVNFSSRAGGSFIW